MTRFRRFAPILLIALTIALVYATGLYRYFSIEELQRNEARLRASAASAPIAAVLIYIAAYAAITGAGIPVALALTLTGGLLFGPWLGGAAAVVGSTTGAVLTFLATRAAAGPWLRAFADRRGGRLKTIMDGFDRDAFSYLLSLRLTPVAPYFVVNLAAGLAGPPLRKYALATAIGVVPSSFVYASVGAGLAEVFRTGRQTTFESLIKPEFIWPLAGLAVLGVLPALIAALRHRAALKADLGGEPGSP